MEIVKGGWQMDAPKYQVVVAKMVYRLIHERRPHIILPEDAERGPRFNSDASVIVRIESNYTEEEFMACPGLAVDAMLIDAAKSDYWYSHEKDYGEVEIEDTHENDGEEDGGHD